MNSKDFESIISNLKFLCVSVYRMQVNIKNISILDLDSSVDKVNDEFSIPKPNLATMISEASEYQSKIDKILKSEFYHLIGMGDLSASQIVKLAKEIKELGKVEDVNKRNMTCLQNLKSIQTALNNTSSYKLTEMIEMKLK